MRPCGWPGRPDRLAAELVRFFGCVADRVDARVGRAQRLAHCDPAAWPGGKAGGARESGLGADSDRQHYHVSGQELPVGQLDSVREHLGQGGTEDQVHAVALGLVGDKDD
jgi:hypothetical protein